MRLVRQHGLMVMLLLDFVFIFQRITYKFRVRNGPNLINMNIVRKADLYARMYFFESESRMNQLL